MINKFKKIISIVLAIGAILIAGNFAIAASGAGTPGAGGIGTPSQWINKGGQLFTNPNNAIINVGGCNGCSGSPSSPLTGVQYNISNAFTADSNFTRDPSDNFYTKLLADTQAFLFISDNGNDYTFQSTEHGTPGNSITLVFNGTDDVDTVVAAWNTANPSNTVVLTSGNGTDVISAQTQTLSGGGVTGIQEGYHDLFGPNVDGSAFYSKDLTSGAFAGSFVGDATMLGIPGLSNITGFIDFANNNFATTISSSTGLSLNYSSPAGNADLRLDSNSASISSGNNWGFNASSTDSQLSWFTPNYNLVLPSNAPSIGDSIQVTGSGGGNYYSSWVAGGGSAAGSDTWVQYNNAGVLGASQDFLFDNTNKILNVGDRTRTMLVIDNQSGTTGFIMGDGVNSIFDFKARTSGLSTLSLDTSNFGGILGATNGNVPNANSTYISVDNQNKQLVGYGLSKVTRTAISFTGSGLNDMTTNAEQFYTGNNSLNTFSVVVTNVNAQDINFSGSVGTYPQVGDVVTGLTTGATGTIFQTDGATYALVDGIAGGPFSGTEVVTYTGGSIATLSATAMGDYVQVNNGPNSMQKFTWDTGSFVQGVTPVFGSDLGHTVGDYWGFDYYVNYGSMLLMDGSPTNGTVTIGDVNGLYGGGGAITMDLISKFTKYGGGKVNQTDYVSTASYNVSLSEYNIDVRVNSIGAAPDVYLPAIDYQGREYVITDEDGNSSTYPITLHAASGQTFNTTGTSTLVINTNFKSVRIHANVSGNTWIVTSN